MMVNGGKEIVPNGIEGGTATYTEISFFKSGTTKTSGCGRSGMKNSLILGSAFYVDEIVNKNGIVDRN